jgi:REP element-mobilizing transposase RayT
MNFKIKRSKRIQEGYIHICVRGNRKLNVFYDNSDRYEFIVRLNWAANEHNTKIMEFALMDNHAHILVSTDSLTKFMSSFLISYVKWYNIKYSTSGNLFESPFLSASKRKPEWAINTSLYILQNPVKAGICHHPADYQWSSCRCHFKQFNSFSKHIKLDTSICDSFFKSEKNFYRQLGERIVKRCELSEKGQPSKVRIPDYEVIEITNKYLSEFLCSRKISDLNRFEKIGLIKHLSYKSLATARQISSITQENYKWVLIHCKPID